MAMIFTEKPLQRGQQVQQLLRFARIAQRQDRVAVVHDAQIAVQRIHAVQDDAGGAGAGERGGDLVADVPRLADADDDEFAALAQSLDDQLHRLGERAVELGPHGFERGQFDVEHFPGLGQMIHAARMPGRAVCFNQE